MGKGILLWLIGIPIPVIIILWLIFRQVRCCIFALRPGSCSSADPLIQFREELDWRAFDAVSSVEGDDHESIVDGLNRLRRHGLRRASAEHAPPEVVAHRTVHVQTVTHNDGKRHRQVTHIRHRTIVKTPHGTMVRTTTSTTTTPPQ